MIIHQLKLNTNYLNCPTGGEIIKRSHQTADTASRRGTHMLNDHVIVGKHVYVLLKTYPQNLNPPS